MLAFKVSDLVAFLVIGRLGYGALGKGGEPLNHYQTFIVFLYLCLECRLERGREEGSKPGCVYIFYAFWLIVFAILIVFAF